MPITNLLRGDKVRLTALTESDYAAIVRWHEDATFMRLWDTRPAAPQTEKQVGEWVEEMQKAHNGFAFAVRPLDNDKLLGYMEIDGINWANGTAGLGMGFGDRANQGQGYGFDAGKLALRFAFDELNLHRVTATAFSYNERSLALCDKLGFQREGVFREFLHRGGQRHDMILMGILRPEWEARHGQR